MMIRRTLLTILTASCIACFFGCGGAALVKGIGKAAGGAGKAASKTAIKVPKIHAPVRPATIPTRTRFNPVFLPVDDGIVGGASRAGSGGTAKSGSTVGSNSVKSTTVKSSGGRSSTFGKTAKSDKERGSFLKDVGSEAVQQGLTGGSSDDDRNRTPKIKIPKSTTNPFGTRNRVPVAPALPPR